MKRVQARAIHIGADALAWPGHAHLCALRSCRDTLARMGRTGWPGPAAGGKIAKGMLLA